MRACARDDLAEDVAGAMRTAGYSVTEVNPFADPLPVLRAARGESPYVTGVRLMWTEMRKEVIASFPAEPGLPADKRAYLAAVHDTYARDAYNSLSIEGYHVTNELIERVASGTWDPEQSEADLKSKDAMAARGYFVARQKVEDSIRRILDGENSGRVVAQDHRVWYRELFAPSVDVKLLKPSDLAGRRGHQVFIRNAAHVPPPKKAVRDMMAARRSRWRADPSTCGRSTQRAQAGTSGRSPVLWPRACATRWSRLRQRPELDGQNRCCRSACVRTEIDQPMHHRYCLGV